MVYGAMCYDVRFPACQIVVEDNMCIYFIYFINKKNKNFYIYYLIHLITFINLITRCNINIQEYTYNRHIPMP